MKSIKLLLAAFAFSAIFAACTKEEMAPVQEIQNDEFVGAQIAGTDVSLNFGTGADTKVTGDGVWQGGDKLGLAWLVKGGHTLDQTLPTTNAFPTLNTPFANHMFEQVEGAANGTFTTKGNVYVGWHFAYFPYKRMPALNENLKVTINPEQTYSEPMVDFYNTALHLSALQFVTDKNINKDSYQLEDEEKNELHFNVLKAPKTILVNVTPSADFTGKDALKNLVIKSIKLQATESVFFGGEVALNVNSLSGLKYDKEGNYDQAETYKALYKSFENVMSAAVRSNSITTKVENAEMDLSGKQTLRIHTLPVNTKQAKLTNVKLIIEVENGAFTVESVANEEDPRYNENNNEAIKVLVEAYTSTNGKLIGYNNKNIELNLELTKALFKENFEKIDSEESWNKAVKMVEALGLENVNFKIVKKDGKAWKFEDVDGDGNVINLPTTSETVVTVKAGEKIIVNADGEWPAYGIIVNTDVDIEEGITLTVADNVNFEVGTGCTITNNGTINAGVKSSIKRVDNNNRINVVYGSYITLNAIPVAGTIAYDLLPNETAARINTLLSGGDNGKYARVNTLVINNGITLDMTMTSTNVSGDDPYYNQSVNSATLNELDNVNIEMNGGAIVGDVSLKKIVKGIKVVKNSNTIKDVNVHNNLVICENAGATLDATLFTYGKKALNIYGNIINNGLLTTNVDAIVQSIDNSKGVTTVTKPYTIWYKGAYKQGGLADGNILEYSTPDYSAVTTTVTSLAAMKTALSNENYKVIVLDQATAANWAWSGTIDLKGKTIKALSGDLTFANATGNFTLKNGYVASALSADASKTMTFDGVTFNSTTKHTSMAGAFYVPGNANVVIKNCKFDFGFEDNSRLLEVSGGATKLTVENTTFISKAKQKAPYINTVGVGGNIVFKNNIIETGMSCEFIGAEDKYTFEDNTFGNRFAVGAGKFEDGLSDATVSFLRALIKDNTFNREDKVGVWYSDKTVFYSEF